MAGGQRQPMQRVRDGVAAVLGFSALTALALALGRAPGVPALLWLGNGLLLGWILRRPLVDALAVLVACTALDVGARLATGTAVVPAGALAGVDLIEVALAWLVLRRWALRASPAPERSLPVALGAILLAPLAGAALAALSLQALVATPPGETLPGWWAGHALGLLAFAPLACAWQPGVLRSTLGRAGFWLGLPAVLAAAAAAMLPGSAMVAPVLVPLVLLLVAARVGVAGTAMLGAAGVLATLLAIGLGPGVAGSPPAALLVALGNLAPLLVALLAAGRDDATQQLHATARRMQALREHAPGVVAQFGRDLRLRFANGTALRWLGRREEESLGQRPLELLDEATAAVLNGRIHRALSGQSQQFELHAPDGRALHARCEPQFDGDGSIEGVLLLAEDIRWRGQAERSQVALLAAADALVLLDAEGRVTRANAAALAMFGIFDGDLQQRPMAELLEPASRELFEAACARLRAEVGATQADALLALRGLRGGTSFPLEARVTRLPDEGRAILAVALHDAGLQESLAAALDAERAVGQVLLDRTGDAIVACDRQRRITRFNPAAAELSGWPCDEALGQPLAQVLRVVAQESGKLVPSPLDVALEGAGESRLPADAALLRRDGARSPVEGSAAPVCDATGGIVGAAMVFRDLSETRAAAMKMSRLAQYDYLTDLPNRVLLQDRLSQALAAAERGAKGALLFLDLDYFKQINDSIGHHAGDKVLQEVARRLKENVRADDTVSRQGGDEFVLLLVRLADPRDAARVAEKLIQAIEQPIPFEGQDLHVSASIGIALFPQDARDTKTLMKQADTALYHAKESGRGRYSYFTGVMSEKAEQRMRMEHDLRFALANEDFFLAYQPKVLLPEGRITGMEALVRWRRSDNGEVVPPGEFIPVCEETGLITTLDEWVMAEACRQNRAWQDAGLPAVPVAVNVSLARFDPDRLLAHVRTTLERTGLAPAWLEVEFTESQMFGHVERAQELIAQLKALGVQVAIDDFGMGYSSLSYLARYPFDTLKIDRSFVQGLPDDTRQAAIVQAIAGMARALDYRVIAEGVEDFAQADALRGYGCHEMQGHLYSRPVPAAEFAELLRRGAIAPPDLPRLSRFAQR